MTTLQIVRLFNGKRSGNWKGRPCYHARCPSHRDRTASLSITQDREGATFLHCFRGCTVDEIMGAKGLTLSDLFETKREMTPAIRQQMADEDRLKLLDRQHGLSIMAQAVLSEERRYWAKVEKNIVVEIEGLRARMFPIEAARIRRESETQRVIAEYGVEELMECVAYNPGGWTGTNHLPRDKWRNYRHAGHLEYVDSRVDRRSLFADPPGCGLHAGEFRIPIFEYVRHICNRV